MYDGYKIQSTFNIGNIIMPIQERCKTKYPGVYYIIGKFEREKHERIYYIYYRKNGRVVTEKAGRQYKDDMTAARAAHMRSLRISGKEPTNKELRQARKDAKEAEASKWTIDKLWKEYKEVTGSFFMHKHEYTDIYIWPLRGRFEPISTRFVFN